MSQKMVLEAKRKEMERFKRIEGVSCCHQGIHGKTKREDDQHQVGDHKQRYRRDKRGDLFAGTPGLMAMRTVVSRAMTRCENGARRSIMLADVKTAFLHGDSMRSLHVELPPEDPLAASGPYAGKLERASNSRRLSDLAGRSPEDTT